MRFDIELRLSRWKPIFDILFELVNISIRSLAYLKTFFFKVIWFELNSWNIKIRFVCDKFLPEIFMLTNKFSSKPLGKSHCSLCILIAFSGQVYSVPVKTYVLPSRWHAHAVKSTYYSAVTTRCIRSRFLRPVEACLIFLFALRFILIQIVCVCVHRWKKAFRWCGRT